MSDFHIGDAIYVRSVGTISIVENILLVWNLGTPPKIVGYLVQNFGVRPGEDLELVRGGEIRAMVDEHLRKRKMD